MQDRSNFILPPRPIPGERSLSLGYHTAFTSHILIFRTNFSPRPARVRREAQRGSESGDVRCRMQMLLADAATSWQFYS